MVRLILLIFLFSCSPFRRNSFTYTENGQPKTVKLVVPKGFNKSETRTDSSGNQEKYFRYSNGLFLYFVNAVDTTKEYQYINYEENIPKELYSFIYFKGYDSTNRYWRESRQGRFRAGYRNATEGNDWKFDSSLNYFMIHEK
jgi:hypothetical protein